MWAWSQSIELRLYAKPPLSICDESLKKPGVGALCQSDPTGWSGGNFFISNEESISVISSAKKARK